MSAAIAGVTLGGGCASTDEKSEQKLQEAQDAEWHYKSAAAYFESNQVTLAIRELTFALEKDPDHVQAHYLMGYIYMGRRNYNKAIHHFKRASEIEPEFYDAKNALGATYLAMERWRDAIEPFTELLEEPLYTSPELAHNNLGWAHYNLRRYPEAIEHFRMATFLKPQFCLGHNNLGLAMVAVRNESEAVKSFRKAVEICPTNYAEPHFNLAQIYQAQGQMQQARAHFKRCSELSPGSNLGDRCREYLHTY